MYICAVIIIKKTSIMLCSSSSSKFVLTGAKCPECNRQDDPHGATGGPLPHTGCKFEYQEPVFAFPSPQSRPYCIECANYEKWLEDFNSGNIYCPGAPRVHTCGH